MALRSPSSAPGPHGLPRSQHAVDSPDHRAYSVTMFGVGLFLFLTACPPENQIKPAETDSGTCGGANDGVTCDTAPISCHDQTFEPIAVPILEECTFPDEQEPSWTAELVWRNREPGDVVTTPVVAQLTDDNGDGRVDEDDILDIGVMSHYDGGFWVISGDGETLWSAPGLLGQWANDPAVGDLDGDGWPEVVAASIEKVVALHGSDGSLFWTAPGPGDFVFSGTVIADLDADGHPEVVVGTAVLDGATGRLLAGGPESQTWYTAAVSDLDRDGQQEVILGGVAYSATGEVLWENREGNGFVAVGDFDGDPEGEVVVALGDVRLLDADGKQLWVASRSWHGGPPAIADFDGDGSPEIAVAGFHEIAVFDGDGSVLWETNAEDPSSGHAGCAAFDFDQDGAADIVYADEQTIRILDGPTGTTRLSVPHRSGTVSEYPVVVDLDGDGHAEIVYAESDNSSNPDSEYLGIAVIRDAENRWPAAGRVWNQHAWSITNVEGNAEIPATPVTNWDTYNTFRSGDPYREDGHGGPDLRPVVRGLCLDACPSGDLTLQLSVENQGSHDVTTDFLIDIYADSGAGPQLLTRVTWTEDLPAGSMSVSVPIDLAGLEFPVNDILVELDPTGPGRHGRIDECYDDNNVASTGPVACP